MTSPEASVPPDDATSEHKATVTKSALRKHAARLTTVGGLLYQKGGENLPLAMQCLQEGVQAMMCLEDPNNTATTVPSRDREIQVQWQLEQLSSERAKLQQDRSEQRDRKPPARRVAVSSVDAPKTFKNGNGKTMVFTVDGYVADVKEELEKSDAKETNGPCHCSQEYTSESDESNGKKITSKRDSSQTAESQQPALASNDNGRRPDANEKHTLSAGPPFSVATTAEAGGCDTISLPSSASITSSESRKRSRINDMLSRLDAESNDTKGAADALLDNTLDEEVTALESTNFLLGGIPGLFAMTSRMSGAEKKNEKSMLTFSEPFLLDVDEPNNNAPCDNRARFPLREGPNDGAFYVAMDQCSRASLFNMGLIHYQWNSIDSAVQFFRLSLSLAQPQHANMIFDPIGLASVNNVGQIMIQNGKVEEAKAMFSDALSRGNSALVELCMHRDDGTNNKIKGQSALEAESHEATNGHLRRFLVRSLLNMAQIHFFNCCYELATRTCLDAMRLLRPKLSEVDAAALWYNIALSHHHQNELHVALICLDKFLDVAVSYLGVLHLQVATALHRKGLIYYEMGDFYGSTKPVLQALRIRKWHFGNKHQLVADSLCLLGKIYLDREEFRYAQNALLQALSVLRALNDNDHLCLDIAQTLIDLGRSYHSEGLLDEALKSYLEVVALTRRLFGERHAYVARMKSIVANIYLEQGEVERALEQFERVCRIRILEGLDFNYSLVQNPHARVKFSHHPTSASA